MMDMQATAVGRLTEIISSLGAYEKGRLVGIGEGMALANIKAQPGDTDTQRSMLGMAPKESA